MDRGTYVSASGGLAHLRKLEVVNNNLANVSTPGFKRQLLVGDVQSFDQTLAKLVEGQDPYARPDHERNPATVNLRTVTDFTAGPIKNTGNPLDVALRNKNDFFVIDTPNGQQYTRAGNFTLGEDGSMVTMDGYTVLGDGGAITTTGTGITISPNGAIRARGQEVGRLQVVRFEDPQVLEAVGNTRFQLKAGAAAPQQVEADVVPQSLEMANISVITSMIELISASRGFEMYARGAQAVDGLNQIAINQIGRKS